MDTVRMTWSSASAGRISRVTYFRSFETIGRTSRTTPLVRMPMIGSYAAARVETWGS
jgi:hypothetical protein